MSYAKAITAINKAGLLLVFPIKNEREPPSLWYALHPKTRMRWDWADTADNRVVDLWHLRTELSEGRDVVYAKWFRGRATLFSKELFVAMLKTFASTNVSPSALSDDAAELYRLLVDDSPQTARMLRAAVGLEGRTHEGAFNRGMRELWQRLLIVGFGEVDEGAFPALAMGSTKNMFEDLWDSAAELDADEARAVVEKHLPPGSTWAAFLTRLINSHERKRTTEGSPRIPVRP